MGEEDTNSFFVQLEQLTERLKHRRLAEVFRTISFHASETYGPHAHLRIEINYVKRGSCILHLEDERVLFREGDIMNDYPFQRPAYVRSRATRHYIASAGVPAGDIFDVWAARPLRILFRLYAREPAHPDMQPYTYDAGYPAHYKRTKRTGGVFPESGSPVLRRVAVADLPPSR